MWAENVTGPQPAPVTEREELVKLASALRKIVSCSAAAPEGGASSDGRRGRRYESGLVGGALMKISKKAIEVFLVATAMLCTLPVHAKVSKPKQLQVTYYYLPG